VATAAFAWAAPAEAANFTMTCKILSSSIPWSGAMSATATPASPKPGDTVKVTVSIPGGYKTGPVPVPAGKLQTDLYLTINGATSEVKGPTNPTVLAPNKPFSIAPISTQVKAKAGTNTVALSYVFFDYLPGQPDTTCKGSTPTLVTFTAAAASKPAAQQPAAQQPAAQQPAAQQPAAQQPAAQQPPAATTPRGALPRTGPEDATRTLLIALVVLQVGLIAAVRWGRRPAYAGPRGRR
jgi:hypothetical protein